MIIDAHLDLAYNVGRGRDVRMPAAQQPEAEGEIATVGFPDMRAGDVGLVFAIQIETAQAFGNRPAIQCTPDIFQRMPKQVDDAGFVFGFNQDKRGVRAQQRG